MMKPNYSNIIRIKTVWTKLLFVLYFSLIASSCEKSMTGKLFQVSDEQMIDELVQERSELSMFLQIVDKSSMRGTIHAYGGYTLFAPSNTGVTAYLTQKGKTISSMTQEEAAGIVKYHLVGDTISTIDFSDGRLSASNFLKKYITTKVVSNGTDLAYKVNDQALITEADLKASNGYLHVIDNVLSHATETITERVKALPDDQYSLFKTFFARANLEQIFDSANAVKSYTLFIQDNDSYANLNIHSIDDLLVRLKEKTPSVTNPDSLIYNYVAYHATASLNYVADLLVSSSLQSLASNQVITIKRSNDQVLLNEFDINGVTEAGIEVDRNSEYTDLSCANGVVQKLKGNIEIVTRKPYRIYWDLAEQPEISALKGFRKVGTNVSFAPGELSEVSWGGAAPTSIDYVCTGYPAIVTKDNNFVNGDYIHFRLCTKTNSWIEFKTPVIPAGKYKVWVGYRFRGESSVGQDVRTVFKQTGRDDQILPITSLFYMKSPSDYGLSAVTNEFHQRAALDGQKQYNMSLFDNANACFLLGTIEVFTTGRHTLRLEPLLYNRFNPNWDVVHFIPIDEDQIWPKQDIANKLIYEDTPDCQIYPYTSCDSGTDDN